MVAIALAGVCSITHSGSVHAANSGPTIPDSLSAAIQHLAPGAELVGPREVDATSCAPVGRSPGLVRADFNGDMHDDYALLLKTKDTGKVTIWEGKELREAEFSFALFLADRVGGYRAKVVLRYTNYLPAAVVLDLQPAGTVQDRETHQVVTLRNPGVTLSFCEKSATTYYLVGEEIRSIPISD
jgi:hypothetical protein